MTDFSANTPSNRERIAAQRERLEALKAREDQRRDNRTRPTNLNRPEKYH